jgi:NodT family efflux transporter outer membrane factor (OMF) lipoprotein
MNFWTSLLAASAVASLMGCAVGPDYATPNVAVPNSFSTIEARSALNGTTADDVEGWWQTLDDPELNSLIQRAIRANPDILIALARVQESRERQAAVVSSALPQVSASAGAARSSGNEAVKGRIAPSLDAGTNGRGLKEITEVAGFDAVWELDLFGKYRRAFEATRYDTQVAREARNAVLITVVAEVARNYVLLRGLQARATVAEDNIARAKQTANVTQSQYTLGISDEYPVTLAKRELATLQAGLPPLIAGITEAEARIAILLGTFLHDIDNELRQPAAIPRTPAKIQPGRPVDLLRRRPDIRQAERALAAATARIGVATADLFPRVALISGVGVEGGNASGGSVSPYHGPIWSVGPGLYWPLLDFGRLDALINVAEFQAQALLVDYRRAIVAAVGDVDQAIKRYSAELDRLRSLGVARDESRRAVTLARERYDRGLTDFLNVLDAERQEYDLEDQYAAEQQSVAVQFVALCKALGGGWELYQALPPIPKPRPAIMATFPRLSHSSQRSGK